MNEAVIEINAYLLGIIAVPTLAWAVYVSVSIRRLVYQHDNPEKTGFGTVGFKDVIDNNTETMRELIHYVKWAYRQRNGGTDAPPYVRETPR